MPSALFGLPIVADPLATWSRRWRRRLPPSSVAKSRPSLGWSALGALVGARRRAAVQRCTASPRATSSSCATTRARSRSSLRARCARPAKEEALVQALERAANIRTVAQGSPGAPAGHIPTVLRAPPCTQQDEGTQGSEAISSLRGASTTSMLVNQALPLCRCRCWLCCAWCCSWVRRTASRCSRAHLDGRMA